MAPVPGGRPGEGAVERYLVVSADGHAGPPQPGYRAYFESRHLADFDGYCARRPNAGAARAAARGDVDALSGMLDAFLLAVGATPEMARTYSRISRSLCGALFDPKLRDACLDEEGIAAEVLYPDGFLDNQPPFSDPMESDGSLIVGTRAYPFELRAAGARAYNRWLADFCAGSPRRAGVAFLPPAHDVAAILEELRCAARGPARRLPDPSARRGPAGIPRPALRADLARGLRAGATGGVPRRHGARGRRRARLRPQGAARERAPLHRVGVPRSPTALALPVGRRLHAPPRAAPRLRRAARALGSPGAPPPRRDVRHVQPRRAPRGAPAPAERVLAPPLLRRRHLHVARGGRDAPRDGGGPRALGLRLPASRGHVAAHADLPAPDLPRDPGARGRRDAGRERARALRLRWVR